MKPGASVRLLRSAALYQFTRQRFSLRGSSGATSASRFNIDVGMLAGLASCENVGNTTPSSRTRAIARARCLLSTISGSMTPDLFTLSHRSIQRHFGQRHKLDAGLFERFPYRLGRGDAGWFVAVNTQRMHLAGN